MTTQITRRDFLKASAAAAAIGLTLSAFVKAEYLYPEVEKQENWWSGQTGAFRGYSTL
ncbi:twin-arginine translocation signal domain-containing protein, partial [Pyrobaculum sp.]